MNTSSTKEIPIVTNNTAITITTIIVAGIFVIYKTHIDAKYNREAELSFDENGRFHLISRPATINNMLYVQRKTVYICSSSISSFILLPLWTQFLTL